MPKKIKKTCKNCVWLARKECDSPKKVCHRWIYKKASCVLCVYRKECKLLGKDTSRDNVCLTFKKIKTKPKTKAKKLKIERSVKKLEKQLKKNPDELKDEFSPVGLIEDIISASYNPKVFELVDDRDIPKADNPIRFITDKSFMGIDLFPMQLKTFLEFFSSYCTRCSDTKFIRNEIEVDTPIGNIFDKTVLYHNGVCPKCGETKYEAVKKKRHCFYNQLIGVAGQRSSKSTSVGIISAAITHEYLKLPSPAEFFGLLPNSTLHGTFVGLRYSDARDNLWAPYYNLLTGTKWFQEYHSFLEEESLRLSTELFKIRDTFVAYNFKNLGIYPSGPDKRKLRGRTRIISALDEVGWFIGGSAGSTKFNPDEIYAALDNSLMTVLTASKRLFKKHPDIPTAYGLYISSPSSKTDKCMRMYKQSKGSRTMYGFHKSTWEFNPNITKKDLNEKYREDPVAAERDFGANPPYSSAPFIKGPSHIVPLFSKRKNLFKVTGYKTTSDSLGGTLLYPVVSFVKKHTFPSVLAVDTGYNHNSFACSLSHWFEKDGKLYYAVSGVIEIIPDPHPVSFPDVYDYVLTPILKEYNVKVVAFDRWQSIDLSQRTFKDHKIQAFSYSVTMKDFIDLKNKIYSGDCMFPKVEKEVEELLALKQELSSLVAGNPISHMFLQFLMCRDTGRTITKGDEITDDILRTICLGYSILTHEDYKDLFTFDGKMLNKYNKIDSIMSVSLRSQPNLGNLSNLGFQVRSVPGIGVIQSRNITR